MAWVTAIIAAAEIGLSLYGSSKGGSAADEAGIAEQQEYQYQAASDWQMAGQKITADDYRAGHVLSAITTKSAASGVSEESGSKEMLYNTDADEQRVNDMYEKYAGNVQANQALYAGDIAHWEAANNAAAQGISGGTGALSTGMAAWGSSQSQNSNTTNTTNQYP